MESYDAKFYKEMSTTSSSSARYLVPFLMENLDFGSVVDFGCGDGQFVSEFLRNGVQKVIGIEGNWILDCLDKSSSPWLQIADLIEDIKFDSRFDLAICLEVAEHIEEMRADNLIRNLVNAADAIFFSAAIPGQGGTNHVNLQYPNYWATKFAEFGYFLDWDPRDQLAGNRDVAPWYQQNCLLYKKSNSASSVVIIPKTVLHPEIFPDQQSFRYKIRKFPIRLLLKVRRVISGVK